MSPFAVVANSTPAWSGWDTQKTSNAFQKKPLFETAKPAPKKEETKKDNDENEDEDYDEGESVDGDGVESDDDEESQLENGDDGHMGKKNVDIRERFVSIREVLISRSWRGP